MKLLSISVGRPRDVVWRGATVTTGIFKKPVQGRLQLRTLNLDGDGQADLSVHGGPHKAVYCYPSEHYPWWEKHLPGVDFPPSAFGENFSTEGLDEKSVCLGDRFRIGSAEIVVSQPRLPCYKLGIKFQADEMVKTFLDAGRPGFYAAVTKEGEVGAGDAIEPISTDPNKISVLAIVRLYVAKHYNEADAETIRRALNVPSLPESWKEHLLGRLENSAQP